MIFATKISKFLETLATRTTGRHRHLADPPPCAEFSRLVLAKKQVTTTKH